LFLLSPQADKIVHSPGIGGVAAVGKQARLAVRADRPGVEDVFLLEAQRIEEPGVRGAQIEEILALEKGDTYLRYMSPLVPT